MHVRRLNNWIVTAVLMAFVTVGCETNLDMGLPPQEEPDVIGAPVIPGGPQIPEPVVEPDEPDEPVDLPPDPPFGNWRLTAGSMLIPLGSYEMGVLTLNEDGTGHQIFAHPKSGVLQRFNLLHVFDGQKLHMSYLLSGEIGLRYFVTIDNANAMRFVGDASNPAGLVEGRISSLSRMADVPDALRTRSLEVVNRFDGLSRPAEINDLLSDGTSLIYQTPDEGSGAMQKIDPDTGAVLDTFTNFSGAQIILTMQDGGFWSHCGCGGSNDARLADGPVTDTVDTVVLGKPIQIHSMAFDDAARVLWLVGSGQSEFSILKVNADAEPDVLLDARPFDHLPRGMTVDGSDLWAIIEDAGGSTTAAIVQFDLTTLKAKRTFHSPDPKVTWTGITMHAGRLFILGFDAGDQGVIMEIAPS